jgi:hypothetical protein
VSSDGTINIPPLILPLNNESEFIFCVYPNRGDFSKNQKNVFDFYWSNYSITLMLTSIFPCP